MRQHPYLMVSALLLSLSVADPLVAAENASITRWAKGTMEYRMLDTREVWGTEQWHLTVHPDGSRTMQSINRMDRSETRPGTQRHVNLRVAGDFRPLEVTAVYYTGGEWRGTGLFAVDGNALTALIKTPNGMIQQSRDVPDHFSFIPHPLATNAWGTWYYDKSRGGTQEQTFYDMDSRARSVGSMLGTMYSQPLEFIGEEEITTPAGTFMTDHFRSSNAVDMYLYGPDAILVRFVWSGTDFILTSMETGNE